MDKKIAALLKELFTCEAFHILKKIPLSPGFPSQNYIGVNFNNSEVLSLKLYYSFFFPVDLELVDGYIPDSTMYKRFINYYTPQTERSIVNNGLTFSLKINNSGLLTKGYHFRFDKNISELPPIKSFQCSADDILNVGLCEEFSSRGNFLKYYYYFNKLYNKEKFAVRFNKPHLVGADLIEYTESDQFNKVIGCNVSIQSRIKIALNIAMQMELAWYLQEQDISNINTIRQ